MSITQGDMIDPQILMDVVRGAFKGKNAFMGSRFVSSGAVRVSGTMPEGGQSAIGKSVTIPYFGTVGDFEDNPDGSSATPKKFGQAEETATVARKSLAIEATRWAQGVGALTPGSDADPYEEAKRQIMVSATRAMDNIMVSEFANTPLVEDIYDASTPAYLDWDVMQDAVAKWGDEQDAIVASSMHSQTRKDVAKLKDSDGRPLLLNSQVEGQQSVMRFSGIPLVLSDRTPLTGSTMEGTPAATGTTPPAVTLTGEPLGAFKLMIDIVTGGASGTATFRFSTDAGNTWSATYTVPASGGSILLDDSNEAAVLPITTVATEDSLVGINGRTGVTATFADGTYNADNEYRSVANLRVTTLICQQDAGAFWFNAARLGIQSDVDILADSDVAASHLYYAPKLYRRRRGGAYPGCIAIRHNVTGYVGGTTF